LEFGLAPVQSHGDFEAMRTQASLAESLGFTTLWMHEHHSERMMYPDPLMALAALSPVTKSIGLGTNMLLLPIHHPLRVAQEAAMLDVLSNGRLKLGVANGYSERDLRAFGMLGGHRGKRLEEGLNLIRRLWRGETVTEQGSDYDLQNFELFPLPLQRPNPPIYVGGHAPVAIDRAARLGDEYLISTTQKVGEISALVNTYHHSLAAIGREPRKPTLNRVVCVVNSAAQKKGAEAFYANALLGLYDAWGHESVTRLGESERAHRELCDDHFIIGEPSECIEQVCRYRELGIGHIACLMNFGGADLELVETSMRLLGEKVMPDTA
jgi:alkanesulfonate monooxygenase SsuD/methylene tetrahydromethanopterin reductase-like flavin-dependent oxidoreductase (luciferase family)